MMVTQIHKARERAKQEGEAILAVAGEFLAGRKMDFSGRWPLIVSAIYGRLCDRVRKNEDFAEESRELVAVCWCVFRSAMVSVHTPLDPTKTDEKCLARWIKDRPLIETPTFRSAPMYSLPILISPLFKASIPQSRQASIKASITLLLWVWTWYQTYIMEGKGENRED